MLKRKRGGENGRAVNTDNSTNQGKENSDRWELEKRVLCVCARACVHVCVFMWGSFI